MKITFTLNDVSEFQKLSVNQQNNVIDVCRTIEQSTDDQLEAMTTAPDTCAMSREILQRSKLKLRNLRARRLRAKARREATRSEHLQEQTGQPSATADTQAGHIPVNVSIDNRAAKLLLWIKTHFDRFSGNVSEALALMHNHPAGDLISGAWTQISMMLFHTLRPLWELADDMLRLPASKRPEQLEMELKLPA